MRRPSSAVIRRTLGGRELAAEVDAWRREQPSIPSESQAFAELIREGLRRWREDQRKTKPER